MSTEIDLYRNECRRLENYLRRIGTLTNVEAIHSQVRSALDSPVGRSRASASSGPLPRTPKWKRELRLLRRDGPIRYLKLAWLVHRFNRSVKRMDRSEKGPSRV